VSQARIEALAKAQDCFRWGNLHAAQQELRLKCINDYGFYDRTGEWEEVAND